MAAFVIKSVIYGSACTKLMSGVQVLPENGTYEYYQPLSQLLHNNYELNSFSNYCADFAQHLVCIKNFPKKLTLATP